MKSVSLACGIFLLIHSLVIGILLYTNHWGMAIRVTNYLYFLILGLVIYEKIT